MFELYEHQKVSKHMLSSFYTKHKRGILCLPTGGGKTVTAASIISDSLEKEGNKLILVDRTELLNQWASTFIKFEIPFRLIRSKQHYDNPMPKKTIIAMVESLWIRLKKDPDFLKRLGIKFVVIDECHKFAFMKILQMINCPVLGLTATPLCSNSDAPLNKYYDDIVIPIKAHELILQRGIVGARTYSISHDWSGLKKKSNGEYTDESQMIHFGKKKLLGGLVDHWKNYAHDKQTVIYNVNIEHSQHVCQLFKNEGVACEHMDSKTPDEERDGILRRFRMGLTQVISNVGLLTTGNDEPTIECIVINRKIGLISTFVQIAGRGARTHTFAGGRVKQNFICLDMGANHDTHGVFGEFVDWGRIFENPILAKSVKGQKLKDKVVCDCCGGVNSSKLDNCVFCKAGLESSKKTRTSFSEMVQEQKRKIEEIKAKKKANLPLDLQGLSPGQMTPDQLWRFIEIMGYKKSYYWVVMKNKKR